MASNTYVAPFYKPPAVATPISGNLRPGLIVLFKDASWSSDSLIIDTTSSQYPEGHAFSFSGTPLQDAATWIAFCLPAGTVCTLFDNVISNPSSNPYNFAGAGVCVDLIGNGENQTVDLEAYGANDCLSAGIWRQENLTEGWFQLFRDANCSGPFNTIFLDEWPTTTANSLSGWWINKEASSINYPCLTPPQVLTLSANSDGTGQQIALGAANAFGSFDLDVTVNFADSGMNDKIQSFTSAIIQPVKAVIQSATSNYTVPIPQGQTIQESISGQNISPEPIQIVLQIAQSQTYTVSSTTTLQYTVSATVSTTVTVTEGVKDVDSTSGSITTSFTATKSETTSKTQTQTQEFQLGQTITFTGPAQTKYTATASVSFGDLPLTTVTTTGLFYYEQELPGSTLDQASGLWVLTTPVVVNLAGAVGTQVTYTSTAGPITT